ncbi:ATP-binding protein [Pedosphaera parvula]|uniref:Putative anti-sigma regulatory factor, serine/threonine protein kinase n=1 Tax=Pedosphaera parvula (strain Ellin514) TaxID=320771 RepID=B9XP31_PEDPL|nr:ATP-binding protein [Pedosphaera parvula]EEF58387.1 putative anti-sigma regulatory factor, serine/threonine protein kinase [Pedosphaera parvula Ellin514]
MTLELCATPEEVMRAVGAFQDFARTQQIPEKNAFGLALALEECGSNIVNYALGSVAQEKFRVSFGRARDEIFIELRDHGPEFDPTAWKGPDSGTESEEAIGGWGIQLVRRYMDEIRYEREAGENVLRLSKRLSPEGGTTEFQKSQTKQS